MQLSHRALPTGRKAFTMTEMVVVIAIITILMTAGIRILGGTSSQSRKSATDTVTGLIEQARTTAITSRSIIVMAIAEPGDLPASDNRCRVGLFRVPAWPADPTTVEAVLIRRWQTLPTGVVLFPGEVDGIRNPLDEDQITLRYRAGNKNIEVVAHAIAFGTRGGLHFPTGSDPVALRVIEGAYRNGAPSPNSKPIAENRLKIGRVVARPYRTN